MMATMVLIYLLALPSFAFSMKDSQEDTTSQRFDNQLLRFDLGVNPVDGGFNWQQSYSIRIGYGSRISSAYQILGCLEYYRYNLRKYDGNDIFLPQSATRDDLALYAVLLGGHFLEIDCGIYDTRTDKVMAVALPGLGNQDQVWAEKGWSRVRIFVSFGLQYELHISNQIILPFRISSRFTDHDIGGPEFILSGGLMLTF
jgi:hypothetical protein